MITMFLLTLLTVYSLSTKIENILILKTAMRDGNTLDPVYQKDEGAGTDRRTCRMDD